MTDPAQGTRLPYSLSRKDTRAAQIGCTFALVVILGGIGVPALYYAYSHPGTKNNFVPYVVGGGFSLLALLLLYSAIHQLFALRTPQTIVEIDTDELVRGAFLQLYFRQQGPARFESLRANLVGEESWWTGSGDRRRQHVLQLGVFNLFDSGPFDADATTPYERLVTVRVPDLPHPSDPEHAVTWQLEVWGKVRGRADFQHVFPVQVRR